MPHTTQSESSHPSPFHLVTYTADQDPEPDQVEQVLKGDLEHLQRLHQSGRVLLAGPFPGSRDGLALFRGEPDEVAAAVAQDPAVGPLFTASVRAWTPMVGTDRLPAAEDPGRAVVEDTIHRLFVEGVAACNSTAYFDRTYHDDVVIHEASSLPYGGDYRGLTGAAEHAVGFTETWDRYQSEAHRDLSQHIVATDNEAFVVWTLRARREAENDDEDDFSMPALSHYRFRHGRIIESRMFLFDTVAVRAFLEDALVKP